MSDKPAKTQTENADAPAASPPGPETQKQRWMKYGANVALASVVVVLLGIVLTALAQQSWAKLHVDTTQAGLYSLKPQTKGILRDLKQDVRIVSLYTRTEPRPGQEQRHTDYATPVADLLAEYERYGRGRVTTEVIDPTQNPAKVDALINDVAQRYGGEVKQYSDFIDRFRKRNEEFQKLLAEETARIGDVDAAAAGESELGQWVNAARDQLGASAEALRNIDKRVTRLLEQKPPNYVGAVNQVRQVMQDLSTFAAGVTARFEETKDDKAAPAPARKYAAESPARYAEIQKQADAVVAEIGKLGELKLDDLRQTLQAPDGIVVMGPKDMRVLPFEQIWQDDPNVRRMLAAAAEGGEIKRQFAGEQQITSAILALTQEKQPKVAFIRAGGPPLTQAAGMFNPGGGGGGPFSQLAARLREYNFNVLEKDLSGMWAMQSQMSGMPAAPEPDEAELKDAVWVVIGTRAQGGGPMGPPPSIAGRVGDHLKAGGSALVLTDPRGEDLTAALADFGIRTRPEAVIVHAPVQSTGGAPGDMINQAQRNPFVFIVNEYGAHPLVEHIRSLDMPLLAATPVQTTAPAAQGVKQWTLLPVPPQPPSWGETTLEGAGNEEVTFDQASDLPGPLFAGAAAERDGAGRVVVLGTLQSFFNDIVSYPDMELLRRGVLTTRFPGSSELFTNSIFWLARMEPMIAISPAALEVSRIEPMSPGLQSFWRNFVLLAGLPLLVLVAGGLMYMRRRD